MKAVTPAIMVAFPLLVSYVAGGAGCARRAQEPQPVRPPMRAEVGHALGSPVDPPAPGVGGAGDPLVVRLRGFAVPPLRSPPGAPLAAYAALIVDGSNQPLATAPPAAESVRLVTDPSTIPPPQTRGKHPAVIDELVTTLPPGCTLTVDFRPGTKAGGSTGDTRLRLGLVSPSAAGRDKPRLLVTAAAARTDPMADEAPAPAGESTLLVDWPLDETAGTFALVFPPEPPTGRRTGRRAGRRSATVWQIEVASAGDDPQAQQASARVLASLGADARQAASRGQILAGTLRSARDAASQRRLLLAVCAEVGADVASEATLLLDDKAMGGAAGQVIEALAAVPAETDAAQFGWLVDRALLAGLGKLSAGGELPPAAGAMLSARFGEAGRDISALAELAEGSASRADFETRVRGENLILLDDGSPASRVRAFEWMSGRGDVPQGYDPLAAPPQRRAAIDAYLRALDQPQTRPETRPATQSTTQPSSQSVRQP